jgi:transcription-repair coupling factor (superfamily II helicase)
VLIPETYVRDLPVRLGLYRRMGGLASDGEQEALAAELVDRFGRVPVEVENLLAVVAIKRGCRAAGIDKLDCGPKGMVLSFRGNAFSNPAGLVSWLGGPANAIRGGGTARLRPDHKLAVVRDVATSHRLGLARDVVAALERVANEAVRVAAV